MDVSEIIPKNIMFINGKKGVRQGDSTKRTLNIVI